MEENRNAHRVLVGKPERDHLVDLGIDARVTLKQYYRNGIEVHKLDYLPQNREE
jgi:hypothetical protein